MNWEPANDFELAIASQPGYNFIFPALCERENYGNQPIDGAGNYKNTFSEEEQKPSSYPNSSKLAMIDTINKMTNLKPPGHQASYDDWKDDEDIETMEKETVAMMRSLGLEADNVGSFAVESETSTASGDTTKSSFNQTRCPSNRIVSKNRDKPIIKKKPPTFRLQEYKTEHLNNDKQADVISFPTDFNPRKAWYKKRHVESQGKNRS